MTTMPVPSASTSLPATTGRPTDDARRSLPPDARHRVRLAPAVAAGIDRAATADGSTPAVVVLRAVEQAAAAVWPVEPHAARQREALAVGAGSGRLVDTVVGGAEVVVSSDRPGVLVEVTPGASEADSECVRRFAIALVLLLGGFAAPSPV